MSGMVQINFHPDERTLRSFGYIAFVGFGAVGVLAWYELAMFAFGLGEARAPLAGSLGAVGALALLFGWVWPRGNRALYVGLSLATFPIGFVLSHVLLAVLFFLVMAPIGWLVRTFGRDPLERAYDASAKSYWTAARPKRPQTDYFRQF